MAYTAPTTGYAGGGVTYRPIPKPLRVGAGGATLRRGRKAGTPGAGGGAGGGGAGANPYLTDPAVVLADLARRRAEAQATAILRQSRSQALIGYGDPDLAMQLGIAVDPNTAAAARANQYSTVAELLRSHQGAQKNIGSTLAARGLINSGELGYQQGNEAHVYGKARYDASNQLLAQLNQYLQQFVGTTQSAEDAYTQALLGAQQNYGNQVLQGLI